MVKEGITGIILAGGESRRLGQDKAFLQFGAKSIIEVIWDKMDNIFPELIISTNQAEKYRKFEKARLVADIFPARCSLNGIYSALKAATNFYGFAVACDMPLINPELIKYLCQQVEGVDVIIPESEKGLEPLCAIYSKNCLPLMERQLKNNNFKIIDFFPEVKVKAIKLRELDWLETPAAAGIFNINTIEDYQKIINSR